MAVKQISTPYFHYCYTDPGVLHLDFLILFYEDCYSTLQ